MTCPRCGSTNVSIQFIESKAKTRTKGMGCLWGMARAFMIFITCGLWLIFGKRRATSNTNFKHEKRALCQSCGHSWRV